MRAKLTVQLFLHLEMRPEPMTRCGNSGYSLSWCCTPCDLGGKGEEDQDGDGEDGAAFFHLDLEMDRTPEAIHQLW